MKIRGTLFLALLLVLLCVAYWGMHWRAGQQSLEREAAKRQFSFDAADVRQIAIHRLGEEASAAQRTDDGWEIIAPVEGIRPLGALWDRVSLQLAQLKNERTIAAGPDSLASYGLDEPVLEVEAQVDAQEEPRVLRFGAMDPTERFRYATTPEGAVFLVNKNEFFELNRSLEELRHRFLTNDREAPLDYFEYVRIWTGREETTREAPPEVGTESVRVVVERENPEALWIMKEPVDAPAHQELIEKITAEIQYGVGRQFVDAPESLADYGLDPPYARITVEDVNDSGTQIFELGDLATGAGEGGLYVRRLGEDSVFVMDAQVMMELPRTPDALRERRLLTKSAKEMTRIRLEKEGGGFVLERGEEGEWQLAAPEAGEINQVRVSNYIAALQETQALLFLQGAPEEFGLDTPEATLYLEFEGSDAPAAIRLTPDPEREGFYLATQDYGAVVTIQRASAERLTPSAADLRSHELIRLDKALVTGLDLSVDGTRYRLEKVHGKWIVREPESLLIQNHSDVETMLSALTPLFAVSVVGEASEGASEYGLDTPVAVVTLSLTLPAEEESKPLKTLTIGLPTGDDAQQRYATVSEREDIFTIRQDVVEALRHGLSTLRPARGDAQEETP